MPSVVVVVFWVWTACSLGILIRRLVTTGSLRPDRSPHGQTSHSTEQGVSQADRVAAFEAKLESRPPAAFQQAPPPSPAPALSTERDPLPQAESLAEALGGIRMPADLVPLVGNRVDPRHMLFSTRTAAPETVGAAIADELERLGFELDPLDHESIAARRTNAALEVRILSATSSGRAGLGDMVSAIPADAIIAQFQLR